MVTKSIDLNGDTLPLPQGVVLDFAGGKIKNGVIIGNQTKLQGSFENIFDNVVISGTWIVPEASTDMFVNRYNETTLKSLLAFSNPEVNNKIVIKEGVYPVNIEKPWSSALRVNSHTDLIIDGSIRLMPNSHSGCDILFIQGNDINILGRGQIIGDKINHHGTEGEWGMGIRLYQASSVQIVGLQVRDCWGDCIYIGGKSKDIIINGCVLGNSRRQGISITSANNVSIQDCIISNIFGTPPQLGIDIEPNEGGIVKDILISNVSILSCYGGLSVATWSKNSIINNVSIRGCIIKNIEHQFPIRVYGASGVSVQGCYFDVGERIPLSNIGSKDLLFINNQIKNKLRRISVDSKGGRTISSGNSFDAQSASIYY